MNFVNSLELHSSSSTVPNFFICIMICRRLDTSLYGCAIIAVYFYPLSSISTATHGAADNRWRWDTNIYSATPRSKKQIYDVILLLRNEHQETIQQLRHEWTFIDFFTHVVDCDECLQSRRRTFLPKPGRKGPVYSVLHSILCIYIYKKDHKTVCNIYRLRKILQTPTAFGKNVA